MRRKATKGAKIRFFFRIPIKFNRAKKTMFFSVRHTPLGTLLLGTKKLGTPFFFYSAHIFFRGHALQKKRYAQKVTRPCIFEACHRLLAVSEFHQSTTGNRTIAAWFLAILRNVLFDLSRCLHQLRRGMMYLLRGHNSAKSAKGNHLKER